MRKIKIWVSTGYVGASKEEVFEVEDDATDEEINDIALEILFGSMIDFNWHEIEEETK